MLLPASGFENLLLRLVWHRIGRARIGIALALNVEAIQVGDSASIGHFDVLRGVRSATLSANSVIGQRTWITAARPLVQRGAPGELWLGEKSALSPHYLNCTGGVCTEESATVVGVRGAFITHSIEFESGKTKLRPSAHRTFHSSVKRFEVHPRRNGESAIRYCDGCGRHAGGRPAERRLAGVQQPSDGGCTAAISFRVSNKSIFPDEVTN
jgi:hypothetical protein